MDSLLQSRTSVLGLGLQKPNAVFFSFSCKSDLTNGEQYILSVKKDAIGRKRRERGRTTAQQTLEVGFLFDIRKKVADRRVAQ